MRNVEKLSKMNNEKLIRRSIKAARYAFGSGLAGVVGAEALILFDNKPSGLIVLGVGMTTCGLFINRARRINREVTRRAKN